MKKQYEQPMSVLVTLSLPDILTLSTQAKGEAPNATWSFADFEIGGLG